MASKLWELSLNLELLIQSHYFNLKKRCKFLISRGDFSWEGGGTLPQNSYKPPQDLRERTL